jgi:hypothetical protein
MPSPVRQALIGAEWNTKESGGKMNVEEVFRFMDAEHLAVLATKPQD